MEQTALSVSSLLTDVGTVISTTVTTMAENPIIAIFLGLGLVTAGAIAFKRLRKSAK